MEGRAIRYKRAKRTSFLSNGQSCPSALGTCEQTKRNTRRTIKHPQSNLQKGSDLSTSPGLQLGLYLFDGNLVAQQYFNKYDRRFWISMLQKGQKLWEGGGVLIYIRDIFKCHVVELNTPLECLALNVTININEL